MPTPEDLRGYRDVVEAVERTWSGESDSDVRARLVHELDSRGLPHPPGFMLDIEADRIAAGPGWRGRARTVSQPFRQIAGVVADIRKLFAEAKPLPHPADRGSYLVEQAPRADVLLQSEAVSLLQGTQGQQAAGLVGVWLEGGQVGISVHTESGRVGVLRDEDVPAYLPIIAAARMKGAVPVMPAVLMEESDGLHLRLGVSRR